LNIDVTDDQLVITPDRDSAEVVVQGNEVLIGGHCLVLQWHGARSKRIPACCILQVQKHHFFLAARRACGSRRNPLDISIEIARTSQVLFSCFGTRAVAAKSPVKQSGTNGLGAGV
jgi:hypothetical protein